MWWKWIRRAGFHWLRVIAVSWWNHLVPADAVPFFLDVLVVQSQRLLQSRALLSQQKPAVVLSDYDRHDFAVPMVLAARTLDIATVTLMHGTVGPSYVPLQAQWAVCWGQRQATALKEAGTDAARLIIGGCPRVGDEVIELRDMQHDDDPGHSRPLNVVLGTTPVGTRAEQLSIASMFCEALEGMDQIIGTVRVHPSEEIADYGHLGLQFPSIRFEDSKKVSLRDSIAGCDVVVSHASGYGDDGILNGRPCVRLLMSPDDDVMLSELGLGRGQWEVRTSGELREILNRYSTDALFREHWLERTRAASLEICEYRGRLAAMRTAEIVEQLSDQTVS